MAVTDFQSAYNSGEISPGLYARTDLAKYESGAALLRNYLVDYRGGAHYRPGFEYTAAVKDSGNLGFLTPGIGPHILPFITGVDAGYLLEFGNLYVRVYRLGVLVTEVVTPYIIDDLDGLKYAQSADVMTLVHPSYAPANLTRTSDTVFTYALISTGPAIDPPVLTDVTATNGGSYFYSYVITAVDADGKEESLPSNIGCDNSEVLDETSGKMVRLAWTAPAQAVSGYNIYKWGPILNTGNPQTVWGYIGSSKTTQFTDNNIAPDFSKEPPLWGDPFAGGQIQTVNLASAGSGYTQGDDGWTHIPFVPLSISGDGTGASGYSTIRSSDSGLTTGAFLTNTGKNYTTATITANGEGGTGATFTTVLSDPDPLYPACVAYYQQRRCFAGADLKPETLILSQTGLYNNFDTTPISLDTDAIAISLASLEVNTIQSMVPVNYGLLVFTTGSVFLVNGGQPYAPVTPSSITSQVQVSNGANALQPLRVNFDVLYIQNKGNKVRSLSFAWQKQTYTGSDITSLCPHLFDGYEINDWCYSEEPYKTVWAVRSDGTLLCCTYVPDQEVYAWTRHDTQGQVLGITSIPEGDENAVYAIIQRYVPSATAGCGDGWVQYIERLQPRKCCIYEAWYLDSALELPLTDGDAVVELASWEEGTTTACFVGGTAAVEGDVIVAKCGQITLGAGDGQDFAVTIVGDLSQWAVEGLGGFAVIPRAEWSYRTPTAAISGLDHLEGKEVSALVDGQVVTGLTVASGAVTLPYTGTSVLVGLPYTGQIMNLYLTVEGLGRNTDQGKRKQVSGVTMRMDCSRGTYLGIAVDGVFPDAADMVVPDELLFDRAHPGALYTGDARALTLPQWDRKAQVCVLQQDPLPSTVLGIVVEVTGGDTGM